MIDSKWNSLVESNGTLPKRKQYSVTPRAHISIASVIGGLSRLIAGESGRKVLLVECAEMVDVLLLP
jgi:hypothetical protein